MKGITAVIKKELRIYFGSPVAYVFIFIFLVSVINWFFTDFWSRNQADIRHLFEILPAIYIILIPALTMRLWSEERRSGTIELLLTLPLTFRQLVIGKFLAGCCVVAVTLLLTVGVPLSVASIGNIDLGPIIGGYMGGLLCAAAYLALGLAISAMTQNQIVAYNITCFIGVIVWLVGEDFFIGRYTGGSATWLQAIGFGARFRSIARGVLDIRDIVFYLSVIMFFLWLNVVILRLRKWR